jgi:hypothetical protein
VAGRPFPGPEASRDAILSRLHPATEKILHETAPFFTLLPVNALACELLWWVETGCGPVDMKGVKHGQSIFKIDPWR